MIAAEIERCGEHNATVIRIDGSLTVDESVAAVEQRFAEALGEARETPADRLALLRHANEAVVSQCLAYVARPWTTGNADSFVRSFLCECADPEGAAIVELPLAAYRTAPVLAEGHLAPRVNS